MINKEIVKRINIMPQYYDEYINFTISADSQAVEYDQLIELSHKLIDSDFFCYFKEGTRYSCSAIHEKAEILYDLLHDVAYYTDDNKFVLLRSNIGNYGTYAIENLLFEEDWEKDVEAVEY